MLYVVLGVGGAVLVFQALGVILVDRVVVVGIRVVGGNASSR